MGLQWEHRRREITDVGHGDINGIGGIAFTREQPRARWKLEVRRSYGGAQIKPLRIRMRMSQLRYVHVNPAPIAKLTRHISHFSLKASAEDASKQLSCTLGHRPLAQMAGVIAGIDDTKASATTPAARGEGGWAEEAQTHFHDACLVQVWQRAYLAVPSQAILQTSRRTRGHGRWQRMSGGWRTHSLRYGGPRRLGCHF